MDIALLLFLIFINGIFSMSEMAIISSRKTKLQTLADEGALGSEKALALQQEPSRFLSTVQVGITSVGIMSGAIGESALADPIHAWLSSFELVAPYSKSLSLGATVVILTYFSVVVGELLPKRFALLAPEAIASLISRPMMFLSKIAHPLVVLLSGSCNIVLKLLGAKEREEPSVTNNEIKVMMEQGSEAGIFHENEQELVSNVLRLDEQRIPSIMTPRRDMFFLDLEDSEEEIREKIMDSDYSRMIVCRGGLENIEGVLSTSDLLKKMMPGNPVGHSDIEESLHEPLYIPESVTTAQLLENFRRSHGQFAMIVNEHGDIQGMVTMTDVLEAIVGELDVPEKLEERSIIHREDGSWLMEGDVSIEQVKYALDTNINFPDEDIQAYHTLGGLCMHALGRIPVSGEKFEIEDISFEIMDMDGNRVDKILIVKK